MKNKALLITFLIVALSVGGYFSYEFFLKRQSLPFWDLVPNSAIAVYEKGTCDACNDSLSSVNVASLMNEVFKQDFPQDTLLLNRVAKLSEKSSLISVHKTTRNSFDYVFYFKSLRGIDLEDAFAAIKGLKVSRRDRLFNGVTIHELLVSKLLIAWIDIDGFKVFSKSSILIEDVIRTVQDKSQVNFLSGIKDVAALPTVKNDAGNIWMNLKEFSSWLTVFVKEGNIGISSIGSSSVLDIKQKGSSISLHGFSDVDSAHRQSILYAFEGQQPVSFSFKNLVSNDALFVFDFGFTDVSLLMERSRNLIAEERRRQLMDEIDLSESDVSLLYNGLGKELTIQGIEIGAQKSSSVFLIDIKGTGEWMRLMDKIGLKTTADTVFAEQFSNYLIKRIESGGLIEIVFPFIKSEAKSFYYTQVGNALVLAEDIRAIKKVLDDFEQEDTWGKSVEKLKFLESTLLESNVSFYVDPRKSIGLFTEILNEEWRPILVKHSNYVNAIRLCAFQFSYLNENFYTSIHITQTAKSTNRNSEKRKQTFVNLPNGIASNLYVVKNHTDKSQEFFVQDSAFNAYLINSEGKILWQKKLDGFINKSVEQIDYFANGKLQLLFSTDKSVHVIDRLGNYVKPFPISTTFSSHLTRSIDYDHSKKYRFMLADKAGVMRMMDKEGNILEGWESLASGGDLLVSPRHYRVSAKDYIAVAHKTGRFTLYTRRGELIRGFPIDLRGRLVGDFYLQADVADSKPNFVFVTLDGYKVSVDLNGKELSRETIIKPSLETKFSLVNEQLERFYIIVRQDNKDLTILNEQFDEIVKNDFIGINQAEVLAFDFGSGNIYYTLTDKDQDLGYVYDAKGKSLTQQPLECQQLKLFYSKSTLHAVTVFENKIEIVELD